jgi:hypothetical protein
MAPNLCYNGRSARTGDIVPNEYQPLQDMKTGLEIPAVGRQNCHEKMQCHSSWDRGTDSSDGLRGMYQSCEAKGFRSHLLAMHIGCKSRFLPNENVWYGKDTGNALLRLTYSCGFMCPPWYKFLYISQSPIWSSSILAKGCYIRRS